MKISIATVAVWLAFCHDAQPPAPPPQPAACCKKCNGTGMVPSGDDLVRVWCECPATCPCAANRPKPQSSSMTHCKDGACHVKR